MDGWTCLRHELFFVSLRLNVASTIFGISCMISLGVFGVFKSFFYAIIIALKIVGRVIITSSGPLFVLLALGVYPTVPARSRCRA